MKIMSVGIAGFGVQLVGLGAFFAISNSTWSSPGKELVIAITVLSMAGLLLLASRPYAVKRSIVISVLLAGGYVLAFHLLGMTYFPGLLKDFHMSSAAYFQAILSVFGILFCLYFLGSAGAALANKLVARLLQKNS
jgi:hypothetical protein